VKDMMKGFFDVVTHIDDETVLENEIMLAGIDYSDIDVPMGGYSMDVCYLDTDLSKHRMGRVSMKKVKSVVSYECDVKQDFEETKRFGVERKKTARRMMMERRQREQNARRESARNSVEKIIETVVAEEAAKIEEMRRSEASLSQASQSAKEMVAEIEEVLQPRRKTFVDIPSRGPSRPATPVSVAAVVEEVDTEVSVEQQEVDLIDVKARVINILEKQMTETMRRKGLGGELLLKPDKVEGVTDVEFLDLTPNTNDDNLNNIIRAGRKQYLVKHAAQLRDARFHGLDKYETMIIQGARWNGSLTPDSFKHARYVAASPAMDNWLREHNIGSDNRMRVVGLMESIGDEAGVQWASLRVLLAKEKDYGERLQLDSLRKRWLSLFSQLNRECTYKKREETSMGKKGKDGDYNKRVLLQATAALNAPVVEIGVLKRLMLSTLVPKEDRIKVQDVFDNYTD